MAQSHASRKMPSRHLLYFADPMCTWCWGFSSAVDHIVEEFSDTLPVRLVMGGIRPDHTQPMDDDAKSETRTHWEQVQVASGQRFNFEFFDRDDFVYNTEPACRAVVTARRLAPLKAIPMMKSVQQAFYTENRDVTQTDELVGIAVATGFDEGEFETVFEDMDTMDETRADFWLAQNSRVTDFPTLIAVQYGKAQAVTIGYSPWKQIGPALKQWMGRKPH